MRLKLENVVSKNGIINLFRAFQYFFFFIGKFDDNRIARKYFNEFFFEN